MSKISTKTGLINYIRSQLGAPSINIEVTDEQIGEIITDTIQKFTEYAYGTLEETIVLNLSGAGEYEMPEAMTTVIKLSQGATSNLTNFGANFGSGFVPNIWSEQHFTGSLTGGIMPGVIAISTTTAMLDKFFGDDLVFNYNPYKNKLHLLDNYSGPAILHYYYEYTADDDGDGIFNQEWVKAYAKAQVKMLWGTVTGKYDQALVGGARINYGDLKNEAQSEIDFLNEQLLTKWSDPAPISIA